MLVWDAFTTNKVWSHKSVKAKFLRLVFANFLLDGVCGMTIPICENPVANDPVCMSALDCRLLFLFD